MALDAIAIDTEGVPSRPWSIQISTKPGTGYCLRCSQPDFQEGVKAIQEMVDGGALVIMHNALFDIEMCRVMGLDLSHPRVRIWDTMYGAFLLRLEPQSLKALAWRWAGMRMQEYRDLVNAAAEDRQLEYLAQVLDSQWPKPEERLEVGNDGEAKIKRPWSVTRRVERILVDYYGKDDQDTDLLSRWGAIDKDIRQPVEDELGAFPVPTLDDVPLDEAIRYSARDSDATLRLYHRLKEELANRDLTTLMDQGMEVLPVFEEMQSEGMHASRAKFEELASTIEDRMARLQAKVSHRYFQDRPFNPASSKQVATLLRRRGLRGAKRTSTGQMSTSTLSIEHLRSQDEAVDLVMEWRKEQKILTAFCHLALERIPVGETAPYPIRCQIKPTRIHTRRLAAAEPNLLQVPPRVRECYVAPEGEVYAAFDLSQIEVRIIAHISDDPLLCRILREGADIHTETAARIFGIRPEDVDSKEHRTPAKRALFGIAYGISGEALLNQLRAMGCEGWTADKCNRLISEWLKLYKGVAESIEVTKQQVRRDCLVRDMWGMVRHLPGAQVGGKEQAEAERQAYNHLVQGGAQGCIQNSTRWLRPRIRELQDAGLAIRFCLQVHDELIFRLKEDEWDVLEPLVREGMTQHHGIVGMRVPVDVDAHRGRAWAELK